MIVRRPVCSAARVLVLPNVGTPLNHDGVMPSQRADGSVDPLSSSATRSDRAPVTKVNCPRCGGPLLPVVYGLPGIDLAEAERRGELLLGGCTVFPDAPTHSCACGHMEVGGSGEGEGSDRVEGLDGDHPGRVDPHC